MPKDYFNPSEFTGEHLEKQKRELLDAFKKAPEDPLDKYPNPLRPAYPTNNRMFTAAQGITKREYFAVMAMQSIIQMKGVGTYELAKNSEGVCDDITQASISVADALLKQLEL